MPVPLSVAAACVPSVILDCHGAVCTTVFNVVSVFPLNPFRIYIHTDTYPRFYNPAVKIQSVLKLGKTLSLYFPIWVEWTFAGTSQWYQCVH